MDIFYSKFKVFFCRDIKGIGNVCGPLEGNLTPKLNKGIKLDLKKSFPQAQFVEKSLFAEILFFLLLAWTSDVKWKKLVGRAFFVGLEERKKIGDGSVRNGIFFKFPSEQWPSLFKHTPPTTITITQIVLLLFLIYL